MTVSCVLFWRQLIDECLPCLFKYGSPGSQADCWRDSSLTPIRPWILAARPKTLSAAIAPVLVGSAIAFAEGGFQLLLAFAALAVALLIQIGTNYHNDVLDFERGTDTEDRYGPIRVTQAGLLSPRQVRLGMYLAFGLAAFIGLYLAWVGGWILLIVGLLSILGALSYTAGPSPLAYNGLGDFFTMIFFGFVAVCGTVYLQIGNIPVFSWIASLGPGALITALLLVNNIRDREHDRRAGRRTIPVRFGKQVAMFEYATLLAIAFLVPVVSVLVGLTSHWALLALLTLPAGIRWFRFIKTHEGKDLNRALGGTADLVLHYGLLLSLGIILGALIP
jgi:1,4-dihydroxy-2-naphthoate octaprenyltransferase